MEVDNDETSLDQLLHRAEQLTAKIEGEIALPRIERNLKQLLEDGDKMWSKTSANAARDLSEARASVLLGSKGFDLQKVNQQLDGISSIKKPVEVEAVSYLDFDSWLKKNIETIIIENTENVNRKVLENCTECHEEYSAKAWQKQKERIMSAFANGEFSLSNSKSPPSSTSPKAKLYFDKSFINTGSGTAMSSSEMAFAKEVIKYVDQKVNTGIQNDLAKAFAQLAHNSFSESAVILLWKMIEMLLSNDIPKVDLEEPLSRREDERLNNHFIRKSCHFLEEVFIQTMQCVVNAPIVDTIDVDMIYTLVRDYLHIKTPYYTDSSFLSNMSFNSTSNTAAKYDPDECVEGIPVFCFLFYCFRAGSLDAAITVVEKLKTCPLKAELLSVIKEYKISNDGLLTRPTQDKMKIKYLRDIRATNDVYKKALYSIFARCSPEETFNDVFDKYDDYLWIKLKKVSGSIASKHNLYCLGQLQKEIQDLGEEYFNSKERPLQYFKMLFLSLQFESSLEFLFRSDLYRSYAVHIALAIFEQNLLILSPPIKSQLLSTSHVEPYLHQLNFSKMIKAYTRPFECSNTEEVVYYYYFLHDSVAEGESMFNLYVSQLVRKTKNYQTLLGFVNHDGVRVPGVIDKFKFDVSKIITQVAFDQENSGLFEDAVKLFDLAGDQQKVLLLMNKMLSPLVPKQRNCDELRSKYEDLAEKIADRYTDQPCRASKDVLSTFYLLIDLMTFFDYYHCQHYNEAFETINKLRLFPFRPSEIDGKVSQLNKYSNEICRNIPDLLLATMDILCYQYQDIKSTIPKVLNKHGFVGNELNKEKLCLELREKARCLITFAGMIRYRMPSDANIKLIQLQSSMS